MRVSYIFILCVSFSFLSSGFAYDECTGRVTKKCDGGFVCITDENVCMPYAIEDNGYNCTYTEQCPSESHCDDEDEVCQCDDEKDTITDDGCISDDDVDECTKRKPCPKDEDVCIEEENPNICLPKAVEANDYVCSYKEQCPDGSKCEKKDKEEEGTCECTEEGYFITDDGCVKGIGAECSLLAPCKIENSHCSQFRIGVYDVPKGECVCDKGYEATLDKSECQLQGNATDDNDYYCEKDWQCENIYEEDEEGNQIEVHCNMWNKVCKCNGKGKYPLDEVCTDGLSSPCVTNEECSERVTNSMCVKGFCECMEDYLPLNDGFHCESNPSEENGYKCSSDEQCEGLQHSYLDSMTCVKGRCSCGDDNVIINNECVHGKIGSECLLPNACGIKHSVCDGLLKKTCECEEGLSSSDDKRACGYKCDDKDSSCASNATTCVEGICQCEGNYAPVYKTVDKKVEMSCVEYASKENGFACEYQEQCDHIQDSSYLTDKPAQCKDGTCTCEEDHFAIDNNKCLRGVGAECSTFINQCAMPNTMCNLLVKGKKLLKGTCACKVESKEKDGYCEAFECRLSLRCPEHSDCNREENECICNEGYVKKTHFLKDECIPLSSPDDDFSCEMTAQCSDIEDTSSGTNQTVECNTKLNMCQCAQELWTPAETSDGFYECVSGAGASCEEDDDCQAASPDSTCQDNVCTCNEGYVAVDSTKKCASISNQAKDYVCTYNEQCSHIPDSSASFFSDKIATCSSETGKCTCADDAYIIFVENRKPSCVKALGGSCSSDFSCRTVKEAACLGDICQCREGYMLPDYELECIPYATPETKFSCNRDEECSNIIDDYKKPGGSAFCFDKHCLCHASDWFISGPNGAGQFKCARELGAKCARNEDCYNYIPNSTCEDTCVCKEEYSKDFDEEGRPICSAASSSVVSVVTLLAAYLILKMTS